jgi:hypothetical protein
VVSLAVLGCLLAIVSLVAVWARNQVLDTDRYLKTVSPLASNPVIQDEIAAKVAAAIDQRLDSKALVLRYLPHRAAPLAAPIGAALEQLVETQSSRFVHSDAFQRLWVTLNRSGHDELVQILTGKSSGTVLVDSGRLTLDLTQVVQAVRDRLAQAGLAIVTTLPPITLVVDVADAHGLQTARTAVRWLDRLAFWLPVIALLLLAAAVGLARQRRRALLRVLGGLALAMLVAHLAIHVGASQAERHVPSAAASKDAVHAYYDGVTRLLHRGATLIGLVACLVALVVLGSGRARSLLTGGPADGPPVPQVLTAALPFVAFVLLLVWARSVTQVLLVLVVALVAYVALRRTQAAEGPSATA